jgi:hypothetical protein
MNKSGLKRNRDRVVGRTKELGIGTDRDSSGFGYVIIPSDIDRDKYLRLVYKTGECMIRTTFNDVYKGVRIPKHLIQDLDFPKKSGEYGSLIGWVNTPTINQVSIYGIFISPKEMPQNEETIKISGHTFGSKSFGTSTDLSEDSISHSVTLSDTLGNEGAIEILAVGSDGNGSSLTLNLDGKASLYGDELSEMKSYTEIKLTTGTDADSNKSTLTLKNTGIFEFTDFNGNFIRVEKGKVSIEAKDGEVNIGGVTTDFAILGDKAKTELNKSKARIDGIIQAINSAPVTPGDGGTAFKTALIASLSALISENYSSILSTKVKVE